MTDSKISTHIPLALFNKGYFINFPKKYSYRKVMFRMYYAVEPFKEWVFLIVITQCSAGGVRGLCGLDCLCS